jgi:hypothetical protein
MLHAFELVLKFSRCVVDDIHPGEEENESPPVDSLADVARDAGELLPVPPMVSGEVERHG